MPELMDICSAFGLSGAAGLNAYIPLLTVAIMQNRHVISLAKPYDIMGQWWVIALLVVLLTIEIIVDKVPGVDHVNDIINTAIRPSAAALLFASQMGHVQSVHPGVWIALGILMGGGVHTGKALSRPVVNLGTAGLGAPVVSVIEDVISVTLSIVAILLPIVGVVLMIFFGWMLFRLFRKFFGGWRKKDRLSAAPAVPVPAVGGGNPPATVDKPMTRWSGGV